MVESAIKCHMESVKHDDVLYLKPGKVDCSSWHSTYARINPTERCPGRYGSREAAASLLVTLQQQDAACQQHTDNPTISRPIPIVPLPLSQHLSTRIPSFRWMQPNCFDAGPLAVVNPALWPISAPCCEALMEATRAAGLNGQECYAGMVGKMIFVSTLRIKIDLDTGPMGG